MLLLGGLDVRDGGQRLFALVGGVIVGLLELRFLVLIVVVFWLLRVGIEQLLEVRHSWRRSRSAHLSLLDMSWELVMATATKGELMMIDQSHCFCAIIIHPPVEALEHRAARDNLRRVKHLRPRLPCCCCFLLFINTTSKGSTIWQRLTIMKLSDIDLDLDAVDLVRLAFLAATAGVSMHSHPRPRLSPG
jgi:hypothetical protein